MNRIRYRSILAGLQGSLCAAAAFGLVTLGVVAPWLAGCKTAGEDANVAASSLPSSALQPATVQPAVTPAASADLNSRPVLVCFGDSLTAGYGTDPGESYPDVLQKLLDAQGFHYHVVNSGISGNTTKDGLERLDRVIARHPSLAVVEFGGNDGLRGLPVAQAQNNLAEIIRRLQASGIEVALAGITLPPDYGPTYVGQFNAMYPALAKQFHVRLLPFLLQNVYGVPGDMQADETHATAKGNQQVAINVEHLIEPLLKR